MTISQKRKTLLRIQELERDVEELKRCRAEVARTGYASATMSSQGGSKSYTRLDLASITEAIQALTSELLQLRRALGGGGGGPWKTVLVVYD